MADVARGALWTRRLSGAALLLALGGLIAALIAAVGSGQGYWHFGGAFAVLRWAFYAAVAGGVLAVIAFVVSWRSGARSGGIGLLAFVVALAFGGYIARQVMTARSVPAIHDVATDLDDLPQFAALPLRDDYLEKVPDNDQPALAAMPPLDRWKAIHREAYSDIRTIRVPETVAATVALAENLARDRGWTIARVDPREGILEATATTLFFRFKDDVVVRVRPHPQGGSAVDMRSISRVGGSDVGANAARIRDFLADLGAEAR